MGAWLKSCTAQYSNAKDRFEAMIDQLWIQVAAVLVDMMLICLAAWAIWVLLSLEIVGDGTCPFETRLSRTHLWQNQILWTKWNRCSHFTSHQFILADGIVICLPAASLWIVVEFQVAKLSDATKVLQKVATGLMAWISNQVYQPKCSLYSSWVFHNESMNHDSKLNCQTWHIHCRQWREMRGMIEVVWFAFKQMEDVVSSRT